MAAGVIDFQDSTFDGDVLQSAETVLVDFTAPWCPPCNMLTPTIESLAQKYAGKVKIGKLNTDENRQATIKYQVQHLPTLIVFRGGEPVARIMGLQPEDKIAAVLDKHVG